MNIGQIARSQQMMYNIMNNGNSASYQSLMHSQYSGWNFGNSNGNTDSQNLMQQMGISGLQGRTAREMAQYQIRTQNTQKSSAAESAAQAASGTVAAEQTGYIRQQYVPISEEATKAMQSLALEDAKNSLTSATAGNSVERANLIRDQLKNVDPSQRTAAFNTMNKVWENEMDRIGNYIQEKDPGWSTWGDKFDTKILDEYKAGVNIWI